MFPQKTNPQLDRVEYQLRATGVNKEMPAPLRSGVHTRGYLPHVKREGARYFVTFRLADSLPKDVLLRLQAQRATRLTQFHARRASAQELGTAAPQPEMLEMIEREYFRDLERYLDKGTGECWLRRPDLADLVATALRFFEGQRYILKAWVIMPNHVHAVLWPTPNHTLSSILQSWKTYTARTANKILQRSGQPFWQPESYDHWIRNDIEHARCCSYVINNPVRARLCLAPDAWRWSSAFPPPK